MACISAAASFNCTAAGSSTQTPPKTSPSFLLSSSFISKSSTALFLKTQLQNVAVSHRRHPSTVRAAFGKYQGTKFQASIVPRMGNQDGLGSQGKEPLFSFGVVADVQYADIPDGKSFAGVPRYYRNSILILQKAIQTWKDQKNISFSLNLGDIVDGTCPKDQSYNAVKEVVTEFEKLDGKVYHMIGNHCLYNLPRSELLPLLDIPGGESRAYYDFCPIPEYRFVVLDGYDISAIGWPDDHPHTIEALKILGEKNPNEEKNSPKGLVGLEKRFVMTNGGVGKEQLKWLDSTLQDATKSNQKVVVCCHIPLDPGSTSETALLWNYDEVMDLIHRYSCVKVCLVGHDHKGGYSVDSHGVHHRSLEAVLECPPGTDAFGYIHVYEDRLSLIGTDRMPSTEMVFNH